MTPTIATPGFAPGSFTRPQAGGELESTGALGEFDSLMSQAVMAARPNARGPAMKAANASDESDDEETPDIPKKPGSTDDKASVSGAALPWIAGLVVAAACPSIPEPSCDPAAEGQAPDSVDLTASNANPDTSGQASAGGNPIGATTAGAAGAIPIGPIVQSVAAGRTGESQSGINPASTPAVQSKDPQSAKVIPTGPAVTRVELKTALADGIDDRTGTVPPDFTTTTSSTEATPAANPDGKVFPAVSTGEHTVTSTSDNKENSAQTVRIADLDPAQISSSSERGMSAAPSPPTMQPTTEMNENSCPTEQNLPALAAASDSVAPAGRDRKSRAALLDRLDATSASASDSPTGLTGPLGGREPSSATESTSAQAGPTPGVHRTIEDTFIGLKRLDVGSVSVVLKPDAGTQLALHLKMQHGRFEALAVLERGDFGAIRAQWSQLQSRLAEQGIRLSPLVSNTEHSTWFGNGSFSAPRRDRDDLMPTDVNLPVIAKAQSQKSGKPAVHTGDPREWWA